MIMISCMGYVCAKADSTASFINIGRLYVGMIIDTVGRDSVMMDPFSVKMERNNVCYFASGGIFLQGGCMWCRRC